MQNQVLFDVMTKSFDWGELRLNMYMVIIGLLAIFAEKQKLGWVRFSIRKIGYVIVAAPVLLGAFQTVDWYVERHEHIAALSNGQYAVIEGRVENLRPPGSGRDPKESFSISGHRFEYSSYRTTTCFNLTTPRGGPIREGMMIRVKFIDECILRIELLSPSTISKPK